MSPNAAMPKHPYALFVSSVPGHLVSRYGSASASRANELLGAERTVDGEVVWHTDAVLVVSEAELARFSREYRRAIATGALRERTEADYLDFVTAPPPANSPAAGEE